MYYIKTELYYVVDLDSRNELSKKIHKQSGSSCYPFDSVLYLTTFDTVLLIEKTLVDFSQYHNSEEVIFFCENNYYLEPGKTIKRFGILDKKTDKLSSFLDVDILTGKVIPIGLNNKTD